MLTQQLVSCSVCSSFQEKVAAEILPRTEMPMHACQTLANNLALLQADLTGQLLVKSGLSITDPSQLHQAIDQAGQSVHLDSSCVWSFQTRSYSSADKHSSIELCSSMIAGLLRA